MPLGKYGKVGVSFFGGGETTDFSGKYDGITLVNINLGPGGVGGFGTKHEFGLFIYRNGASGKTSVGGGFGWEDPKP